VMRQRQGPNAEKSPCRTAKKWRHGLKIVEDFKRPRVTEQRSGPPCKW